MPELVDYYTVLGVPATASAAEIRKARQRLAMLYHPDRNKGPAAHQMMALVNRAAEVLLDPTQRSRYDAQLAREQADPAPDPAPAPQPDPAPTHRRTPRHPSPRPRPAPEPPAPSRFGRALRGTAMALITAAAWGAGIALGVAGLLLASGASSATARILWFLALAGSGLLMPSAITAAARRMLYGRDALREP